MVDADATACLAGAQSHAASAVRIYVLKDPRTGAIRYVGKTCKRLEVRFWQHTGRASNLAATGWCARWIRSLRGKGLLPLIEQIEVCGADWAEREAFWIAHYRAAGCRLTNLTRGGEGVAGLVMTPDQRAKVRAARQSPKWRSLISGKMRALWSDPVKKAERSAKAREARASQEFRAKASARMIERWADGAARQAQAERTKETWTPARSAAQTAGNNARWADPVWRAATIEKMRAAASTSEARAAQSARSRAIAERRATGKLNGQRHQETQAGPRD